MRQSLTTIFKCMKGFGIAHGIRIGMRLATGRGRFCVSLPGYQHPIWVRSGTSDVEVFISVFADQEYASGAVAPERILDLGANVGYASIYFANTYPEGEIIAVEPDASNYETLLQNVRPYHNIMTLQRAVWPRAERIKIGNPDAEKWLFQIEAANELEDATVKAITMPELLAMGEDRPIDILKVDIESAEKQLFGENSEAWLGQVRLMIVELHDFLVEGCSQAFYTALKEYEFNQWINGENIFVDLK